jgi:hypothetical protein
VFLCSEFAALLALVLLEFLSCVGADCPVLLVVGEVTGLAGVCATDACGGILVYGAVDGASLSVGVCSTLESVTLSVSGVLSWAVTC